MKCFGLPWGALAVSCAVFMSGCGDERDSAATAPPLRAALGSGQFAIQIDATILSASELNLSGIGAISTGSVQSVTLDPGSYSVSYGEPLTGAAVIFSVTAAGTVDFDASLNGILTGRGTTTLVVQGAPIQVDARALSAPTITWLPFGAFSPSNVISATLLPGTHRILYGGPSTTAYAIFSVTTGGTVDFDPSLDGILAGRGAATLVVQGAHISIDATALSSSSFSIGGVGSFPTASVQESRLLPGTHEFNDGNLFFIFSVTSSALLEYSSSLDGTLSGRGTNALIVWGDGVATARQRIDVIITEVQALVASGRLTPSQGNPLIVQLMNAEKNLDKGKTTQAINNLQQFLRLLNGVTGSLTVSESEQLSLKAIAIIAQLMGP